jgi:hypothetical protein
MMENRNELNSENTAVIWRVTDSGGTPAWSCSISKRTFLVRNATGVTWKSVIEVLSMPLVSPLGIPSEFVDTNNATEARMDSQKQWNWVENEP